MKYFNKVLLTFLIALFCIVIYFGLTGTWYFLFILPILTISGYVIYYLHSQMEKEEAERQEKAVELEIEDEKAAVWIKDTLVPQTISYGKKKRRTLITYAFIFLTGIIFLWQFISYGLNIAVRDTFIAGITLFLFIYYIKLIPHVFHWFSKLIPKQLQKYELGNWGRAYIFLLPITIIIYLLYPFEKASANFREKILTLPVFFVIYTFLFLGLYCIIYINSEIQKEEKKHMEKEIKDLL